MNFEYKDYELSNAITDIAAGPFGSNLKVSCFTTTGFPIIDGANLKEITVTDNITKFVPEDKARSLHRSIAKRRDVVVTISGNVGQVSYIPDNSQYAEYLCSQRQFRVTFDESKIYVPYLVYYLHSVEGQSKILAFANQTGVPALSQPLKNFRKIKIDLPSLAEQKKIAAILSALDEKIATNREINENLERQAQALVKEYCSSTDSEIALGSIMNFVNGFAFQSKSYQKNGKYRIVTIKNVQDGRIDTQGAAYIDEVPAKMKNECYLRVGDILLSLTGNVGRVGIVFENNLLLNQRVAKFTSSKDILPLLYFFFRLSETKVSLETIAKGTAQQNLSPIETLKLSFPYDEDKALILSQTLKPMFDSTFEGKYRNIGYR